MNYRIRRATAEDISPISSFTTDTFEWGDYVPRELPHWLADEQGLVLVAVDDGDRPVAMCRTVLLSPREAWLHAARVHPAHQRRGLGRLLNDAGCSWAAESGALIARLLVEDWNEAATAQVEALGYRRVARWMSALLDTGTEVLPSTNGGRRVPGEERLTPGTSSEADLAWMSWTSSELATAGRQLFPLGWHFRRLQPEDLSAAARRRELWHCPSGWVMASADADGTLTIPWVSTTDLDASRLTRALIDLSDGTRSERIRLFGPRIGWLEAALDRAGFVISPNSVFARTIA